MNDVWSKYVQGANTLHYSRKLRFDDIFSGQYQVYYGIHEDEAHLHIHYAINAVSYVDGKKWHKSRKEIEKLEAQMRERAKEVLRR